MWVRLFPLVLVCLCVAVPAQVLDETASSAVINSANAEIVLVIDSSTSTAGTKVDLDLLDERDAVRSRATQRLDLKAGKHSYPIQLPIADLIKSEGEDSIGWYRVQYRIGDSAGIVSMSELLKDVFEIRAAGYEQFVPGSVYRMRVSAINPFTNQRVRSVKIEGKLELDTAAETNDEIELTAASITNSDGLAILNFKIPTGIRLDMDPEFEIVGRKNGVVRKIENDFELSDEPGVFFTSDKPMYQPGETFNLRGLFLDQSNTVVAGEEIEISIEDEQSKPLFSETVTTSEYGVASISWKIPADARLGKYEVEIDGEERYTFKVARYDLPNFVVSAEADKTYYLTTETTASVTVGADYLFGKPVKNGKVRIVQENERRWDWDEQEYEIDEGQTIEGDTNPDGKFIAKIDLREDIEKFQQTEWERFKDIHFAAYFTDTTTNRTEEKRFDVRITKEPIHVYLVWYADQSPHLPVLGYISTFYADGSPAECTAELSYRNSPLDSIETNSMGAGKFKFVIPAAASAERRFMLKILARDSRGQRGRFYEDLEFNKGEAIQLETDKAIYKPRDVIKVDLVSTQQRGLVYVDLVKDGIVLESRHVNLRNGKAQIQFGYSTRFTGELTIAAYNDTKREWNEPQMRFARDVIFPEKEDFRLDAKFDRKTYRPGEDGRLRFAVSDAARPAESALGITIFDRAIEERARTDSEFRSYFGGFAKLMDLDRGFGNITLKDLNSIDVRKPISDDMQLAAEMILAASQHWAKLYQSSFDAEDVHTVYSSYFKKQIGPIEKILMTRFDKDFTFPTDEGSLEKILKEGGADPASTIDPWRQPYVPQFSNYGAQLILALVSKGPDKRADTEDDFIVSRTKFGRFNKLADMMDRAVTDEYLATGKIVRDDETFRQVLEQHGVDPKLLNDPWKRPYRVVFEATPRNHIIRVSSLGPDGIAAVNRWGGDDFEIAAIYTDGFAKTESAITNILRRKSTSRKFPTSVAEFAAVLMEGGLDLGSITDTAGEPVYVTADAKKQYVSQLGSHDGRTVWRSVPVSALVFTVRSRGSDKADAGDDSDIASFSEITIKDTASPNSPLPSSMRESVTGSAKGAIRGTVTDPNGAVIPNVEVTAYQDSDDRVVFVTNTDDEGGFLLPNLPSGRYTIVANGGRMGFREYRQSNILVRSQRLVELEIALDVGHVSAMVEIAAVGDIDQTTNSMSTNVTRRSTGPRILFPSAEEASTPRLREYFPETLLWQPNLVTDARGRAEVSFKIADNITSWKMYAIASTKDGRVGVAEKEFTTFQPFFVDLDPPKFLTEGDSISLPVQVRNYTGQRQPVKVMMTKGDWFSINGSDSQSIDVDAGGSKNAIFTFRADTAVTGGKQRVTAIAKKDSDAIEKPVTVRSNGHEIVRTDSKIFHGRETFKLDYPANAMTGTQKAEIKIYPNLLSHVTESVEGLLKRPYGCGEQTISSTYPNVMVLKFVKGESTLRGKASQYLKSGYERLIGYQVADGGFSYWGGTDESNVALTAYALRFLHDAKEFIDVDKDVVHRAESYLMSKQQADGSWQHRYVNTATITAYVARSIATRKDPGNSAAIQKAFTYLDAHRAEINDAYTLALFGLAALDAGDATRAKAIAGILQQAGVSEDGATHWLISATTPFNGWGKTGRIETTALVTQLLIRTFGTESASGGMSYLLKNKDEYGVWYSTQTTINVLDTFLAEQAGKSGTGAQSVEVFLNGALLQSIAVDSAGVAPIRIDLSGKLNPTTNVLEVRLAGVVSGMAQTVATVYVPWSDMPVDPKSPLVLDYKCDKTDAAIMAEINCSVEAGRRISGYGMLLAEIGLPPGADVDRESLERLGKTGSAINRYDILPDRIIVYFWASGPPAKFNFSFRPRYGIDAQTPPSVVYDYYNPDAKTTVAPLRFAVR